MKIHKYEIPMQDNFHLILPEKSKILTVQLQNYIPQIWIAVTDKSTISYDFSLYGTGHKMNENLYHKYIGTFQLHGFVWHLFQTEDKKHVESCGGIIGINYF